MKKTMTHQHITLQQFSTLFCRFSITKPSANRINCCQIFTTCKNFRRKPDNPNNAASSKSIKRQWIQVTTDNNENNVSKSQSTPFTLMSYNILSQSHLQTHHELYVHHDKRALNWSHRLNAMRQEIKNIAPSILCMQEVQQTHLNEISDSLSELNYGEPVYKKRSGSQIDGCAIFFDRHRFELVETHFVDYFQPSVLILNRCNVAIIAKLALKSNPNVQFVVSTTHLLFNPKRHDVRVAQVQVLLAELDRVAHDYVSNRPIPIILSGDFNFQQNSKPYRLIIGDCINIDELLLKVNTLGITEKSDKLLPTNLGITDDCQHYDVVVNNHRTRTTLHRGKHLNAKITSISSKISDEDIERSGLPYNTGFIKHNLNLAPTMLLNNDNKIDIEHASTHHHKWIMVDYIFYTNIENQSREYLTNLKLLANYQLPTINKCLEIGTIPNLNHGSDHYSIAAQFEIGHTN